ncbi:hypothetical protein DFH07DRAFT_774729 [Mycena maculata]|uniref:DUF6532 domain-containing protein n=1 Tax=Mycena maculata TaxID=230809 RepID=A0AAD7N8L7_9AGAR|nr:hypothetical protein DFH07DRAFT_774729 [Mycena maculata]
MPLPPPRRIRDSDSDDSESEPEVTPPAKRSKPVHRSYEESEDEGPAPTKQPPKPVRRSRDDLSGNQVLPNRTRHASDRQPTRKQANQDKENLDTAQQRIARLENELKKTKRQSNLESRQKLLHTQDDDEDDFESEEQDHDNDTIQFASSIRPLGIVPVKTPRTQPLLRKSAKSTAPPKTSSRAFLTLPEVPAYSSDRGSPAPPSSSSRDDELPAAEGAPPAPEGEHHHEDRHLPSGDRDHTAKAPSRKRAQPSSSPAPAPPVKRPLKEPDFAEGYKVTASRKPKAVDYQPVVTALLIRAMAEYSMLILTLQAFPDITRQSEWANKCFRHACQITSRGSHIRSQLVTEMRTLFAPHFNFKNSATSAAIQSNIALSKKLLKKALFGYKVIDDRTGYAGNKILDNSRHCVIFQNKRSLGAIFASHFDPYPLPTLALKFTVLTHCAQEWSTGQFVPAQFTEKDLSVTYTKHLKDIEKWAGLNPAVVQNMRHKWYTHASNTLGLATVSNEDINIGIEQEAALREELDGRTGATDSESDGDLEDLEAPDVPMEDAEVDANAADGGDAGQE